MDTTNGQPADDTGVGVNFDTILAGYADALAAETQRRIMADATVAALQAERATLRAQLAERTAARPRVKAAGTTDSRGTA